MLIQSTNLKNAHLMDFFEVMNMIAVFLKKEDVEALKLSQVANEFTNTLTALEKALAQARKTGFTEDVLEADHLRDSVFTGFMYSLKGMTYFPNKTISDAATQIANVIEKYGSGIQRLPQREESAVLTSIITNLKDEVNAPKVETINLVAWVEELEKANDLFKSLYAARTEKEAKFIVGLTKDERNNMQNIFVKLCRAIDAYAFIEGDAAYKPLADKINTEVDNVQQAIKARAKATKLEDK